MAEKIAVLVRVLPSEEWQGTARLYKVTPPMAWETWSDEYKSHETSYVAVSAVNAYSGPETYIFPADRLGNVISWGEMEGSFRGELNHVEALRRAGYKVVKE